VWRWQGRYSNEKRRWIRLATLDGRNRFADLYCRKIVEVEDISPEEERTPKDELIQRSLIEF